MSVTLPSVLRHPVPKLLSYSPAEERGGLAQALHRHPLSTPPDYSSWGEKSQKSQKATGINSFITEFSKESLSTCTPGLTS